ncbi:hypothetical protein [Staphylococcus phage vB_StaM_SA1]|nr:hypothetical protein [Staphylococcus phage vB_StaM_SA1]
MGIKYRKSIQEKYNVYYDKVDKFMGRRKIDDGKGSTFSSTINILIDSIGSEHNDAVEEKMYIKKFDTMKDCIRNCDFKGFERKMDFEFNITGEELEYLNRMDMLTRGKRIFAVDKDYNIYRLNDFIGFRKEDSVGKMRLRKLIKNKKGRNIKAGPGLVREPEYPFIVIDLSNGKYKFDREYFENVFLRSEEKLVEELAREKMEKQVRGDEFIYINEGIEYDLDFNIVRDINKEEEKINSEKRKLVREFLEREKLDKTYFDRAINTDYQEAKQYLLRNGFNWSDLKRMNNYKIFLEANSLVEYKAKKENIEITTIQDIIRLKKGIF